MSRHVPLLFRDPFFRDERDFWDRPRSRDAVDAPAKLFDQHFGSGVWPEETPGGTSSLYMRSRRAPKEKSGIFTAVPAKEKFSVSLEVPQFTPDELKVRVVATNILEVEGRHAERSDEHGTISRHFVRKYTMPEDTITELINSSLSPDGVLSIEAPRKPPEPPRPSEREIPIQKTSQNKE